MDKVGASQFSFQSVWFQSCSAARLAASLAVATLSVLLLGKGRQVEAQTAPAAPAAMMTAQNPPTEARPAQTEPQPAPTAVKPGQSELRPVPPQIAPFPPAAEMENWRRSILKVPTPKLGCFTADYPATAWREVPCKTPPHKLYPPRRTGMLRTDTVGGAGTDFSAVVTGHITESEGSFDSMTGVTSECEVQCPGQICPTSPSCTGQPSNSYTLQLNSAPFTTSTCSGAPPGSSCQGWEQFVYAQGENCSGCTGDGFIQYWLLNYGPAGTSCPAPSASTATCSANGGVVSGQWCSFQFSSTGNVYCVINADNSASPPTEPITSLNQQKLTGDAAGGGASSDSVTVWEGNTPYKATGGNYFPDLGSQWQEVEFNVFGDGGGSQAVFNSGSDIHERTGVLSGTSNGPSCDLQSFTGESNNLTLVNSAPTAVTGTMPALLFSQSSSSPGGATCADATSVGDTHMTTFDGLYYDFQASGDFVLVQAPDFAVHARLASGAPSWPNASVNKGIATQMGKTTVEVDVEPDRLLIDGKATNLNDGQSTLQATGVQVTRHGSSYRITSESGNSLLATINSNPSMSWIDVTVGLGKTPSPNAHGLLGNPAGDARQLVTATGQALNEPVSFTNLYTTYGDSWRVATGKSLFNAATTIKAANPTKTFFASDLTPAQSTHAQAVCKAAGITNQDLLDSCTLDTTVLNNDVAAKAFTMIVRTPIHVIRPIALAAPVAPAVK